MTGATWTTDLVNGTALSFNGSGNYVRNTSTTTSIPDSNSSRTFSFWLKSKKQSSIEWIISTGGWASGKIFAAGVNNIGNFQVFTNGGYQSSSATITNNTWDFYTVTYDGSILKILKNNIIVYNSTISSAETDQNGYFFGSSTGVSYFYTGLIDEVKVYNYALNLSEITAVYQQFQPVPAYPTGGLTIPGVYPPLTTSVTFSWHDTEYPADELVVAEDTGFNVGKIDIFTSNDYYTTSLESGKTYYWKVRQYNSSTGTYGDTSITETFSISQTTIGTTGTGIHGVVSDADGAAISGATIYLYNNSYSTYVTTGSNGYYAFPGLVNNSVYNIYAIKSGYDTTPAFPVTSGNETFTTNNIVMKQTEPTDFESDKQYVKFKARWLWCFSACDIQGATISVYKSGDAVVYASGVTDSTGSISFRLYKAQLYRVTVVNATAGISQEMTLYPKDTEYVFLITNAETSYQDHPIQEKDAINIAVTKAITNATSATITVNYTDSLSGTTALTYYLNQSNNMMVQPWTWENETYNHTFTVSPYSGKSYVVHVVATQSTYGTIDRSYAVPFEKSSVGISGLSSTLWLWFAIAFMFFTGAIFTSSTAEKGLLIVCAEGWIFFFIGMFASLNAAQFVISLTLASVIAVFAYIKRSKASEGYA